MREWCRRKRLPGSFAGMLEGEDEDFQAHIRRFAEAEACKTK